MPSGMYLSTRDVQGGGNRRGHKGHPRVRDLGIGCSRSGPSLGQHTCCVAGLALGLAFPPCKMDVMKYLLGCVTVGIKSTEMRGSNAPGEHCGLVVQQS